MLQDGNVSWQDLGMIITDALMDMAYSGLYTESIMNFRGYFRKSVLLGIIDASVDILEMDLYFTEEARERNSNSNK